jgi:hypothetical protein
MLVVWMRWYVQVLVAVVVAEHEVLVENGGEWINQATSKETAQERN